MPNENAARAERAEQVDKLAERFRTSLLGSHGQGIGWDVLKALRDYAAALRSADADRPARAAEAPALTALLADVETLLADASSGLLRYYIADKRLAACRAELAALTTEPTEPTEPDASAKRAWGIVTALRADNDRMRTTLNWLANTVRLALDSGIDPPSEPEKEPWVGAVCRDATPAEIALAEMLDRFDCVGNGYCSICGRHRLYNLRGGIDPCSNVDCPSHRWRAALDGPRSSDVAAGGERAEVAAFAGLMEDRLRRHDDRRGARGWRVESRHFLFGRLREEVEELRGAVVPDAIAEEAADVANYAMMIADVAGGLSDRTIRVLQQRRAANVPSDVPGGWPPGTLSTERLRREMPALAAVADSAADELVADVQAGGEPEREPYRGDTFQSIQSGSMMDPATWEYIPDPFTTAPATNTEPAFHEPARIALDRLIAERDQWKDRCERLAELVEALEARIRILEESASQQSEKAE
jgi:NTP pyrophosphatase (non-canonical NTP hydrolase)